MEKFYLDIYNFFLGMQENGYPVSQIFLVSATLLFTMIAPKLLKGIKSFNYKGFLQGVSAVLGTVLKGGLGIAKFPFKIFALKSVKKEFKTNAYKNYVKNLVRFSSENRYKTYFKNLSPRKVEKQTIKLCSELSDLPILNRSKNLEVKNNPFIKIDEPEARKVNPLEFFTRTIKNKKVTDITTSISNESLFKYLLQHDDKFIKKNPAIYLEKIKFVFHNVQRTHSYNEMNPELLLLGKVIDNFLEIHGTNVHNIESYEEAFELKATIHELV